MSKFVRIPGKSAINSMSMALAAALLVLFEANSGFAQNYDPLPEGNTGIAVHYPGDTGISGDGDVIFADDFESYVDASELDAVWNDGVYHHVRIARETGNVYAGGKSLEFMSPQQAEELSNGAARVLDKSDELDILFFRYYTKFDASFDISGSSHNGGGMSAHYYVDGNATPGVPADGTNKFLAEFESWRADASEQSPGQLNVYIYHPEQRTEWGDHFFPDGTVLPWTYLPGDFGAGFTARPNIVCELGRWYCCELMVQANTPGQRDGRIACWLDGALIADFGTLRLRDVDSLKINRFNLSLHSGSNTAGQTWKWYDNVVAATSYIGPMSSPGPAQGRLRPDDSMRRGPSLRVSGKTAYFSLAKESSVTIDICTLQGKIVKSLINATLAAGNHRIAWDGCCDAGAPVAGGMYVARIKTPENMQLRSIVNAR